MSVDWELIKELEAQEAAINAANPVQIEVTWQDWLAIKDAILLLRRIRDNTKDGDLNRVERPITELLAGPINAAFRANPGTAELRAEIMELLKEAKPSEVVEGVPSVE